MPLSQARHLPRRLTATCGALAVLGAMVAGSASSAEAGTASGGQSSTLTVASSAAGLTPDFSTYTQLELMVYDDAVYDFPMHLNPVTNALEPWAVTSWSYNTSKTALTLNLRHGMKFTNNTPVNATALADNFEQRIKLEDASFDYTNIASIDAPTDYQVVIHLKSPDSSFLAEVAMTHIAAPAAITSKDDPIGSGPYILDKARTVADVTYVFTRNPNYWNRGAFPYNTIIDKIMTSTTASTNALISGQAQYADIDADNAAAVRAHGDRVILGEGDSVTFLIVDRTGKIVPALGNVLVRQALNYAINRPAIQKYLDLGQGSDTSQYFLPGSPFYIKNLKDPYSYDVAKAKQLLAEAGYPHGFNIGTVPTLWFPQYQPVVQQDFAAIGVKINFAPINLEKSVPLVLAGDYPGFVWGDSMPNPGLEMRPDGIWNPLHSSTPELVSLWKTIDGGSAAAAAKAMPELAEYLYKNAWFVQIGHTPSYFAAAKDVKVVPAGAYSIAGFDGAYLWNITPAS
jgi:peptide/nickel transport system substrate-binding protein